MAYQQQQQQQQDNRNPNRLHLNFGGGGGYQQPNFAAEQGRAFPTTPSTFPQPFPNAAGQQEVWGTQQGTSGINAQGYFYNNPTPYNQYGQQQGASTPGGYRSPQQGYDVTNGLAHQFQHQNLGGNTPRSASPYNRQPSPANSRPRTGGQPGQQQYGGFLGAGGYQQPQGPSIYDEEAPPKNSDKYSTAITERVKLQKMLTQEFFKENVERARARNERCDIHLSKRLVRMRLTSEQSEETRRRTPIQGLVRRSQGAAEEQHAQVRGQLLEVLAHVRAAAELQHAQDYWEGRVW